MSLRAECEADAYEVEDVARERALEAAALEPRRAAKAAEPANKARRGRPRRRQRGRGSPSSCSGARPSGPTQGP